LSADELLDREGEPETGKEYTIKADRLRALSATRKAFRELGVDPAHAPAVLQRWVQLEQWVSKLTADQAQQQPQQTRQPDPKDAADKGYDPVQARKTLREIEPDLQKLEAVDKLVSHMDQRTALQTAALFEESHDFVQEVLEGEGITLEPAALRDVEDLILQRIGADKDAQRRYFHGPRPLAVVEKLLMSILKEHKLLQPSQEAAAAAERQRVKEQQGSLLPRMPGGTTTPGGAPAPPKDLEEATKLVQAVLGA
jgi:hypothetical protein